MLSRALAHCAMLIFFLMILGYGAFLTLSSIHRRCSFLCLAKSSNGIFHFVLFIFCLVLSKSPFPSLSFICVVQFSINIVGFFCTFTDHFLCLCVFSSSGPSRIPFLVCIIFYGICCFWNLWKPNLTFYLPQYVWIQLLRKSPVAWFFIYISTLWLFMSVGLNISFSFI